MANIAVIDDDSAFANLIASLLKLEGHTIHTYSDAIEGSMGVMQTLPDLVTCDLEMRAFSGIALINNLRSWQPTARIPVIVVSSEYDPSIRDKARLSGAAEFVAKSRLTYDLIGAVNRHLPLPPGAA